MKVARKVWTKAKSEWIAWYGETPGEYFTYTDDGTNATITGYNGLDTVVVIPSKIDGYNVTAIANGAFYNEIVTRIEIPNGVTINSAHSIYSNTSLTSIKIGDNCTIQSDSICGNSSLNTVELGSNVTIQNYGIYGTTFNTTSAGVYTLEGNVWTKPI